MDPKPENNDDLDEVNDAEDFEWEDDDFDEETASLDDYPD